MGDTTRVAIVDGRKNLFEKVFSFWLRHLAIGFSFQICVKRTSIYILHD
jgi:hypothetical protein